MRAAKPAVAHGTTFDVRTGAIIAESRPWRRPLQGLALLIIAGLLFVALRALRSKPPPEAAPPAPMPPSPDTFKPA